MIPVRGLQILEIEKKSPVLAETLFHQVFFSSTPTTPFPRSPTSLSIITNKSSFPRIHHPSPTCTIKPGRFSTPQTSDNFPPPSLPSAGMPKATAKRIPLTPISTGRDESGFQGLVLNSTVSLGQMSQASKIHCLRPCRTVPPSELFTKPPRSAS